MKVFIDTNKYLDFYRASDESLVVLKDLIEFVEKKKIELIVPQQVFDEFIRDKEFVYSEFVGVNFKEIQVPVFLKKNNKRILNVNKTIIKLKDEYKNKFFSPRSEINVLFKKLFSIVRIISETPEILQSAYYRTTKGNPPRKGGNSFGDAIIWETLIRNFSDHDLTMISRDGDWSSDLDKHCIHPFLANEWSQNDNKKVTLRKSLSAFIKEKDKQTKITEDIVKEEEKLDSIPIHQATFVSAQDRFGNLIGSDMLNTAQFGVATALNTTCSCCGRPLRQEEGSSHLYLGDRCDDCLNLASYGYDCESCGKHYHEPFSSLGASSVYSPKHLCPTCSLIKS